ncbi:MAG TPA: MarR family transcriptional regulator [Cytophagaceae bacterium]|jgi:DNA-binding MarR family transcriptional regulator
MIEAFPTWKIFTELAKKSLGIISQRLEHTVLDKYYFALTLIHKNNGSITQQKLAEMLNTDKVTIVRVIDHFSKKGLVKRSTNKEDRREHLLFLTTKALKIIPEIEDTFVQLEKEFFKGIDSKKQKEFLECLNIIEKNISDIPTNKINLTLKVQTPKTLKK